MLIASLAVFAAVGASERPTVVADAATKRPLPGASVFDCRGKGVGVSNSAGHIPYISPQSYPVTVRYLGYRQSAITSADVDTVFLNEIYTELPEVVVESRQSKVMHILAYVREYSTLYTYSDTVFLFREKMVDYMITPDKRMRFKGWDMPRVLKSKSYYRFTDAAGLDSVSDACRHHFSWSDWMGLVPPPQLPPSLKGNAASSDTVYGKYSPAEVWSRRDERVTIDVDVLADTCSRKWVPNLSTFFRNGLDFERFRVNYNYDNVTADSLSMVDLKGYSFNIESNGRGHEMFRFNSVYEPFFVSTYGEVYILDKEFITVKEAKKWQRRIASSDYDILEPADAPPLTPDICALIDRVNLIDSEEVRLALEPDHRLGSGRGVVKQNFGDRALMLLKQFTGISRIRSQRKLKSDWREFRQEYRAKSKSDTRK